MRAEARVLTQHGVYSQQIGLLHGGFFGSLSKWLESKAMRSVDALTCVSRSACEYYKCGLPLPLLVLLLAYLLLTTGQRDLVSLVHNLAGYLSSFIRGEQRYDWWRSYAYYRVRHFVD